MLAGRGRLHSCSGPRRYATRCGLLAGRGRLHWRRDVPSLAAVAACSRAGVGYTVVYHHGHHHGVAACSRAGVGYTASAIPPLASGVAACSRAGVGYTATGSPAGTLRCGLLAGRGRLHCGQKRRRRDACCGLLAGRGRLHCCAKSWRRRWSCGLLAGRGRLHYFGLRTSGLPIVAACSRAGVGYTRPRDSTSLLQLRLARGPGSVTLKGEFRDRRCRLRLARGPGSVTLSSALGAICHSCGLLAGRGRLHSTASFSERP